MVTEDYLGGSGKNAENRKYIKMEIYFIMTNDLMPIYLTLKLKLETAKYAKFGACTCVRWGRREPPNKVNTQYF